MAKNGEKESSPVADQSAGQEAENEVLGEIASEDKEAEDDAHVGAFGKYSLFIIYLILRSNYRPRPICTRRVKVQMW